jgi:hypothetical protein
MTRKKSDYNLMGLDGLNIYLDSIESLDLEEYTLNNTCYLSKNLIASIRRGRITINNSNDDTTRELWETTIHRCFDVLEDAIFIINAKIAGDEIAPSEKAGVVSLLSDYVKCLNEEEVRLIKKEEKAQKILEATQVEEEALQLLDGTAITEIVGFFESLPDFAQSPTTV